MIRMVNLSCPKCSLSLDVEVDSLESYCPVCGGKLYMSVPQVIDVLDQKKEIKRKDVKYATVLSDVQIVGKTNVTEKKKMDIWPRVVLWIFIVLLIGLHVLIRLKSAF